jgi:hypothetical protein
MPNKFDSNGMIHQWIYVIVPAQNGDVFGNDPMRPYFCAFCKICRTYFTEFMPYGDGATISPSSLPRYGCVLPDDIPVI